MKTVKIKFVGFWNGFESEPNLVYDILKKHYDVKITDDADYIICSMFGIPYEYCSYPQVRIMFSGENYIPDFNLVDYALCPYPISFLDRCCYAPVCLNNIDKSEKMLNKDRNYSADFLKTKEYFANFIVGHESENCIRGDFFKKLSEYKRVESPGSYLNNMHGGQTVSFLNDSKISFQKKCKFTICFESTKHEGFVTEKITDAFLSDTIPIYYGSSTVTDIFNSKAFINCNDYSNFDEVIKKIIELDNDDEKYLEMLRQPIFVDADYVKNIQTGIEKFVLSIFDQPLDAVYRRSRIYSPNRHEMFLNKWLERERRLIKIKGSAIKILNKFKIFDFILKIVFK
ncbi:MAG: hypothetical protein IJZ57_04440 [Clostridia bacterium]|nr:hypothetical protein [Clostridia bacterium]